MKRKFAALLACILAVSVMAGCGDKESTESGATESVALKEATTTPSVEVVATEGTDLSTMPVEEWVTLGEYKNLTLTVAPKTTFTEEEVDEYVQSYFYNDAASLAADKFPTEGTVEMGNVVLIDYEGKKGGVAFEGGTAKDATLGIGSGQFIAGFEDGLVGVKAGETVDLNLTFPENYGSADLAGQAVVFTVTVKGIAGLNDATIKNLGMEGVDTVKAYEEAVESMLLYQAESEYFSNVSNAVCEALIANSTVTKIPESIYEQQKEYVIQQVQMEASYYGVDGDTYTQVYTGMNLADYAVGVAEAYTKQAIIFQAVANKEGIAVSQEDVDAFVKEYVEIYGASYGIESVEAFYEYNSAEDVKNVLLQENVVNFVTENSTIKDAE